MIFMTGILLVTLSLSANFATGQDQAQQGAAVEMAMSEVTDAHRVLFSDAGVWDADITMHMGAESTKTKGVETSRKLGRFWMVSDLRYELMGEMFHGHGQMTYDSKKKKYVGTWIDSMSDFLNTIEGDYDKKSKTLTMIISSKGPQGEDVKMKMVTRTTSETTKEFRMTMMAEPKEIPLLEISYTKRAKGAKKSMGKKEN